MQTRPKNWGSLFSGPHKTEYKFLIDGTEYSGSDLQGTPVLTKPLMDQPSFGRCCSGTLTVSVRKRAGIEIPKAASVVAFCRLSSKDSATVTDWVEQGHFCISKRQGRDVVSLTCRDLMGKAGRPYASRTTFEEWPVPMADVVAEIVSIMGVSIDPRTVINTGPEYVVTRPSDDTLMSEVLSGIAAAHFGSWIMTEKGQLRLVTISAWGAPPVQQEIGHAYGKYTPISMAQKVSRLTLTDSADNAFTVGDDTGRELVAQCEYATQSMCDRLLGGAEVIGRALTGIGSVNSRDFTVKNGKISGRSFAFSFKQFPAVSFTPYILTGAYIDPCLELGDTVAIEYRGAPVELVLASMTIRCNVSFNADVSFEVEQDDEDEYPYTDLQTLQAKRVVTTHKSYYGTKISRDVGFESDRVVDGEIIARLIANADKFTMQQLVDGEWKNCIYFDPVKRKYVLSGDVEIAGALTVSDLEDEQEEAIINGNNIKPGTISASNIYTGKLSSKNGVIVFDLDNGRLTIGSEDAEKAFAKIDNAVTILASSQMFTRTGSATQYSPDSITLTAQTSGNLVRYKWYKNSVEIAGQTGNALSVTPADISGDATTYKVIAFDAAGNEYVDFVTIAKVADGAKGTDGKPGADGKPGEDGYTIVLGDEYIQVSVDEKNKPNENHVYTCAVNVFKGTTALTPTMDAPGSGNFRVSVEGSYTGLTVSQPAAGTIAVAVSTAASIDDLAKILLKVTTDTGGSLNTYINIAANLNSVVTKNTTDIKLLEDEVSVRIQEVETSVTNLQKSTDTKISEVRQNTDSLSTTVGELSETTKKSVDGLNDEVNILFQKVSTSITKEDVQIEIEKQMGKVDSVTTKTGFTFNEVGLTVGKSDSEMATTILDDGMRVKRNGDDVLVANSQGVDAENLHATTYLIVGRNSRFEDYGDRTGCFWIGQGE